MRSKRCWKSDPTRPVSARRYVDRAARAASLVALLVMGCSGSRSVLAPQEPVFPPAFERDMYPFEVRSSDGTPLDHPFLGGLNLPRPQFADIDGDGDLDLFVQEVTGALKYFENVGAPTEARFVWRTNRYKDLNVGEWYRLHDVDQDGDLDILGELPFSYVRLFRNVGTPTVPNFELVADSLRDAAGKPLFADRQNIPTLTDIDCNGRLDLFIGRIDGTLLRYESVGLDDQDLPRFRLLTNRFEDIEIVGQFASLHGANTLTFHDVDNDGDEDLFWGDFFEPGLLLIPNTGSCKAPDFRNEPFAFPPGDPLVTSGYNAPGFADIDGDSDKDLFVGVLGGAFNPNQTAAENFYFLEADGQQFTVRSKQFLTSIDVGAETIPAFADLDGDGDQDLLLSNKIAHDDFETGRIFHYENQGASDAPSFQLLGALDIAGAFQYAPALADMDADGDLDMFVGTWNQGVFYYRNTGDATAPVFTHVPEVHIKLTRGSNCTPVLVDIDADGDLDLFIGESSGDLNFYRNTGTDADFSFELVSDNYGDIDVGRRSAPTFTDLDGDGDQDLVVGREANGAAIYRNMGTPELPEFAPVAGFPFPLPINTVITFVDIDGDGDKDLFSGGLGGGLVYYENVQGR